MLQDNTNWVNVEIPESVKAVVLLNLQSYGGGRDLWGKGVTKVDEEKNMKSPKFDDGFIEVSIC